MQLVWQLVEETELAISTKNRLYITSMTIIGLVALFYGLSRGVWRCDW